MLTTISRSWLLAFGLTLVLGGVALDAQGSGETSNARLSQKNRALNLNAASATQLQELPGIGVSTATRIVEYREKHGPFKKIEELMNIRGIGEKSFLRLKPLITVTPSAGKREGKRGRQERSR
jgi:competence protein ComEA